MVNLRVGLLSLDGVSKTTKTFSSYDLSPELLFVFFSINCHLCLTALHITVYFFIKSLNYIATKYTLYRVKPLIFKLQ